MGMDKLKGFFGGNNNDEEEKNRDINEDEYYEVSRSAFADSSGNSKMILFEPRAYSESQQIVDYLKKRKSVSAIRIANTPLCFSLTSPVLYAHLFYLSTVIFIFIKSVKITRRELINFM